ncbi:hypothetical protein AAAC51_15650 [Priestia megaterium]
MKKEGDRYHAIAVYGTFSCLNFWGITSFIHYRNQTIKVRLNKHYTNAVEWIEAVKQELEKKGKSVSYEGISCLKLMKNLMKSQRAICLFGACRSIISCCSVKKNILKFTCIQKLSLLVY